MKIYKYILFVFLFMVTWGEINAQKLRVMNYNCRLSGQMVDYSVKPFATFIRKYNPDVIMLQEVDYKTARNKKQDFTTQLAAELGMFSVFGYAVKYQVVGEFGVAILSKYPLVSSKNMNFVGIIGGKETRTLLYVDVVLPETGETVRIASTHLDHSTDEVRTAMVKQINAALSQSTIPTILAGDFNAPPTEGAIKSMRDNWQQICDNTPTFPAKGPTSKIDYLFGVPVNKWKVNSFLLMSNTEISDHCALITDVEFIK